MRQYEQIINPLGATFTETDDFERPIFRGGELDFNEFGFEISASGGTRLPLGDRIALIPEIGVEFDDHINRKIISVEYNHVSCFYRFCLGESTAK